MMVAAHAEPVQATRPTEGRANSEAAPDPLKTANREAVPVWAEAVQARFERAV